jgi:predicted TIM-barrel fold metal-dependent hydrolase
LTAPTPRCYDLRALPAWARGGLSDTNSMIVDCHTHTWESPEQLGRCVPSDNSLTRGVPPLPDTDDADMSRHWLAAAPVNTTIVLGFTSKYLGAEISNDRVAAYVGQHPDRLIGFAGVDPSDPKAAREEMLRARGELSMRGLAIAPAAQDFHPSNSQAMVVYAEADEVDLPILFHTGVYISAATKLEYARPMLIDEVARELPDLKIVIAHMGYPWVGETVLMLAKHEHVYAEISWLLHEPWQAYQALLNAYQLGVTDKLLFGSGFPFASASHCIEELYSISHLVHGTNLPTIPREQLRGIVERDALSLLGIPRPVEQLVPEPAPTMADDEQE